MINLNLSGRKILIIDDSDINIQLLSIILKQHNFIVHSAVLPEEGYRLACAVKPDLILLDIFMPNIDGYELCCMLRRTPETMNIPVIFLTASHDSKNMVEGFKVGAVDFITKPFNQTELLARLNIHLRLKISIEEIEESERNYRLLFNNMTNGFALHEVIFDNDGAAVNYRYLQVNPAYEKMTGFDDIEIIGKCVKDILPDIDDDVIKKYGEVAKTGIPISFESFSGRLNKYYEILAFSPNSGQFATIMTDITAKKITEIKLKEYNEDLEKSVEIKTRQLAKSLAREKELTKNLQSALIKEKELGDLKTRFVSMASHEFKTPLTIIMSACDILLTYRDKYSVDKIDERLNGIKNEVTHLSRMINDILHVGKPLDKEQPLQVEEINVKKYIENIGFDFSLSDEGKHNFVYEISDNIVLFTDSVRLKMVITNIISNALKYSPSGSDVIIRCFADETHTHISIRDFGIGIPVEHKDKLFEPFHRFNNVGTIKGTGLGLSITKREVDILGGDIFLNEQIDKGCEFTIVIPSGK